MCDCFCEENSFGYLYVIVPDGFCAQGSLVIFASSKEKMRELLQPIKTRWDDLIAGLSIWKFEIVLEEIISMSPVLLNTVLSDTLDMV